MYKITTDEVGFAGNRNGVTFHDGAGYTDDPVTAARFQRRGHDTVTEVESAPPGAIESNYDPSDPRERLTRRMAEVTAHSTATEPAGDDAA